MNNIKTSTMTATIALIVAMLNISFDSDRLYFLAVAFIVASFICQAIERIGDKEQ